MLDFRLHAYDVFNQKMRQGADLTGIDFDNIHYYVRPQDKAQQLWKTCLKKLKILLKNWEYPKRRKIFSRHGRAI